MIPEKWEKQGYQDKSGKVTYHETGNYNPAYVEYYEAEVERLKGCANELKDIALTLNDARLHNTHTAVQLIQELQGENARLREQLRWRKYPEEVPTEEGEYFVRFGGEAEIYGVRCYWSESGWEDDVRVELFLPLPPTQEEK